MAGRKRESFSPVDAAWLHMDRPTNRMMITGVFTFDEPIDFERWKKTIEYRFLQFTRFRQRVKEPFLDLGTTRWELDPDFDLSAHVHRVALPEPGDHVALQELVGELMSTPLDFNKPLWQMHLVENYGKGCAIITRLHHSIADGMALVQVLLSMTDKEPNAPWPEPPARTRREDGLLSGLLKPVTRRVSRTIDTAELLLSESWKTVNEPGRVLDAARFGANSTLDVGRLVLLPPDHKTVLRGKCSGIKRAAWTPVLKLEEVKAVGHAFGATINDVLLTAVSGALRRYLIKRGDDVDGIDIRAMVPVNLRPPAEPLDKLGNRFGLVILSLPVGAEDLSRRLRILKRNMDDLKHSPEPIVTFGILSSIGITPNQVERLIVDFFASKTSAVMTNVPGPRETLYLAGRAIKTLVFWVPTSGNIGLGVSIMSYAGNVMLGIMTDAALAPDPGAIIYAFQAEFAAMKRQARVSQAQARAKGKRPAPRRVKVTPNGASMCKALTKTGQPCKNHALPGTTTCVRHAKKKTAERVAA